MKLFIVLVLFKFCYSSNSDANIIANYESKIEKSENDYEVYKSLNDFSGSRDNDRNIRSRVHNDRSVSNYNDDKARIDKNYEKYIGEQINYKGYGGKDYAARQKPESEQEMKERLDKMYGFTGPTANDEPENLVRPCALDDWQCIRKFFAANGNCKPAYGPIPDPLYVDINTAFFTLSNVTATLPNLEVRGLSSGKIREFYFNKKSGNLVFAFDIQDLNMIVPRIYIRFRRTAKESIVLADYGTVNFRSATFTAVIPKAPGLRLDLADVHTDVQDGTPVFFVGPEAITSPDPDVGTAFAQFVVGLPIAVREGLLFLSQLYTSVYIQNNVCDFGLKLISV